MSSESAEANAFEWTAYYDDEGRMYYYNATTEESTWDPPEEGFNPPDEEYEQHQVVNGGKVEEGENEEGDERIEGLEEEQQQLPNENHESPPLDNMEVDETDNVHDSKLPQSPLELEKKETTTTTTSKLYDDDNGISLATVKNENEDDAVEGVKDPDSLPTSPTTHPYPDKDDADDDNWNDSGKAATTTTIDDDDENDLQLESTIKTEVKTEAATDSADVSKAVQWVSYQDNEGREYYYNNETGETSWDKPDYYVTADEYDEIQERLEAEQAAISPSGLGSPYVSSPTAVEAEVETEDEDVDSKQLQNRGDDPYDTDDDNSVPPSQPMTPEMDENEEKEGGQVGKGIKVTTTKKKKQDTTTEQATTEKKVKAEEDENADMEIDLETIKLQKAEESLHKTDSILEPSCISNVFIVVPAHGGNPERAIKSLIDSYHGQTAVCGLLSRWYVDFKKQLTNSSATNTTTTASTTNTTTNINTTSTNTTASAASATTTTASHSSNNTKANGSNSMDTTAKHPTKPLNYHPSMLISSNNDDANIIRDIAQDVIYRIAKERFTREAGDSILDLNKSDVAFLEEMMDSSRWRKLLIDLSASSHKDSAVLLYCLRAISKRGHHREIAKRINQSDHFAVFNAMLLSELAVIGCIATSAGSDISSSSGFDELVHDLQRACTSTSYTYLYSIEMLRTLRSKAMLEAKRDEDLPMEECRFHRAIRKWDGLCQLLESTMVDPSSTTSITTTNSSSSTTSSPLFRKRRLDVALTMSTLHQRQRRRKLRNSAETGGDDDDDDDDDNKNNNNIDNTNQMYDDCKDLETALLMLLRRYSTGTQIGDVILDKLLPTGLDIMNTRNVGFLLLDHPLAIQALLGHLYKPGTTRINTAGTKTKCARLVALSVLAAEHVARTDIKKHQQTRSVVGNSGNDNDGDVEEEVIDEVALTRMIVQGSQLCEHIETTISFSVTTDFHHNKKNVGPLSSGQKLCALALKCAPVGYGTIMWAREFTNGPEFAQSASFPTISPSIMSLVRLIAIRYPFTRNDALMVALAFLRHTNPDISYQKVNSLKEQALRLMIALLVKGSVAPVLTSITNRLSKSGGTSELDASLVRYFVGSVLEVVKPPYSPVFVRLFSTLLNAPRTIDAVRSTYFAKGNKQRLGSLLQSFQTVTLPDGRPLDKEDTMLVLTALSAYQIE